MEEPRPEEPRLIEPSVPARRDSRAIRGATPHNPMRPVLIGVAVVAVLGGAIALAGRYQRGGQGGGADPAALVTPGAMNVEDDAGGGGAPKPDADARGTGPMPVRFYEVLAQGRKENADSGSDIAMRSLPLPPKGDGAGAAAAAPARTAQIDTGAGGTEIQEEEIPPAPPQEKAAEAPAPAMAAKPPTEPPAESADMPRPYTLQVGSFSRKDGAEKLAGELKEKGLEAYLAEADLGAKGVWYRVRVGRFPTEHAAKWARLDLVREGLQPIVVHDPKGP